MLSSAAGTDDGNAASAAPGHDAVHWPDVAGLWAKVGPPLRPSSQDLGFLVATLRTRDETLGAPRALILGVTPELHDLPWPEGTDLLAIDHTPAMIDAVWPGARSRVICSEWTAIPLPAASRDIVLCDGGLHLLSHPVGQQQLVRALARIIAPGGLCVLRLFVPPAAREEPARVLQDLLDRRIPTLNILKLRLAMALQATAAEGVELGVVWNAVRALDADPARLAARIGWSLDHLTSIDTYRGSRTPYHFVGIPETRHLFCEAPGGFEMVDTRIPTYELGERCPTIVLRRRKQRDD